MNSWIRLALFVLLFAELLFFGVLYFGNVDFQLLNPSGIIAREQRDILILATLIMLTIIIPVVATIFYTSFKYRARNKNKTQKIQKYNKYIELFWWVWPSIIILIIAVLTWNATHRLDPNQLVDKSKPHLKIQVVSLQWKWLFLYPEQNIATLNYLKLPVDTPVEFELTSDAPMNSFWIPSLSGQIYAMTGMSTRLNMSADKIGEYPGTTAEISGKGFSGMRFIAAVVSSDDFESWVAQVKSSGSNLSISEYDKLSAPSENVPVGLYSSYDKALYNRIISKYTMPKNTKETKDHN